MNTGSTHICTLDIQGVQYEVYGCWDEDTPDDEYDFYDVHVGSECINEGSPFWDLPTVDSLAKWLEENNTWRNSQ